MEYPTITAISPMPNAAELDATLAHEIGHNWFYGILGNDQVREPWLDEAGRSRSAWQWQHEGRFGDSAFYSANLRRVSDDGWWKDFPDSRRSVTTRLLSSDADLEQPLGPAIGVISGFRNEKLPVMDGENRTPLSVTTNTGIIEAVSIRYAIDAIHLDPIGASH